MQNVDDLLIILSLKREQTPLWITKCKKWQMFNISPTRADLMVLNALVKKTQSSRCSQVCLGGCLA